MTDYADWTGDVELLGTEIQVPIDIQGAFIQVPIDIQGQYVTLDIDIVAQSVGNISIDIAAQSLGSIDINIAAQNANITIDIVAQSVAIKSQGEWAPEAGINKRIGVAAANEPPGGSDYGSYMVPTGKVLYITDVTGISYAVDNVYSDLPQNFCFFLTDWAINNVNLRGGGSAGMACNLTTPLKYVAGTEVRVYYYNFANHACHGYIYASGYEK